MNFWGIFGKKQTLPNELCAVTEVDLEWVESQTKLMEKIAQTIEIRQYKTATASIAITPVNATRRLRERIEKFGTDNLETKVNTRPIDENTTRMGRQPSATLYGRYLQHPNDELSKDALSLSLWHLWKDHRGTDVRYHRTGTEIQIPVFQSTNDIPIKGNDRNLSTQRNPSDPGLYETDGRGSFGNAKAADCTIGYIKEE